MMNNFWNMDRSVVRDKGKGNSTFLAWDMGLLFLALRLGYAFAIIIVGEKMLSKITLSY